jgi:phenylpropionate dioxygenase-like ring-hydroxylating dioxygenase large terminal subunit
VTGPAADAQCGCLDAALAETAAMLPTRQKVLRRFWYPVMPEGKLGADRPEPFRLLGEDIVLWRGIAGPAALADRCPHRGAKLSMGFVDHASPDGPALACGYHGWAFGADGRCRKVPQAHDPLRGMKGGATAHRAAARYGWIWVALDDPIADIPHIPEAGDTRFRRIDEFHEVWAAAGLRVMENSFDNAHFTYVHAATFGIAEDPRPAPVTIEDTDWGFVMRSEAPVNNRGISRELLKDANERTVRIIEGRWFLPFFRASRIDYPSGVTHVLCTGATPIDDRHSMICQWVYRSDGEADAPAEKVIAFDRAVTLEDKAILEGTTWDVPLDIGAELHMPADKPGIEMRRRLSALLAAHGESEVRLPPAA